jgi:hypothetical protein
MEWISVKDRLPKKECRLIVFADDYVCEADYGDLGDLEYVFSEAFDQIYPTHWMPLPDPPKQ